MNEGVVRSPKWMRNFVDFEINTGDDIKGKPSKRKQKKIDEEQERLRKKAEEIREERKKEEQKETDELFSELFKSVMSYIFQEYRKCYIHVDKDNFLTIEKDDLTYKDNTEFEFEVTLDNRTNIPTFNVILLYGKKILNYKISGLVYTQLRNHMLNDVYQYYKMGYSNKKGSKSNSNSSKSDYSKYSRSTKSGRKKTKEEEERENKERRYKTLKSTLDGYRREYMKLVNSGNASQREIDIVLNQLNNTKDKINNMNNKFKFESIYFMKHLKRFYS